MLLESPEINTFIVQPTLKDRSQIIIYLNQLPRSRRDQERLFGLAEIKTPDITVKNEIQIFLTQIATKYQEETIENPAMAFEQTLEWANRILRERLDQKKLQQINLVFGCLKNSLLQFATLGNIISYIFFKEKNSFQKLDLLKAYSVKSENHDLYFSNLISGDLHHNNFVLFSLPNLLDFLSLERVEKIITQTKPTEICDHLETILNQIENKLAFGGLLLEWPGQDWQVSAPSPVKIAKATPDSSIRKLIQQEQDTAKILTPSLLSNLKNLWQKKTQAPIKNPSEIIVPNQNAQTLRRINKIYTRLTGWQGELKNAAQIFLIKLGKILFKTYLFFKKFPRFHFSFSPLKKIHLPFRKILFDLKGKFFLIPLKRRIVVSLSFVILLTLIISLTYTYYQKKSQAGAQKYNQLVNDIKSRLTETESNLLYDEEAIARVKLASAKNLLSSFPRDSKENNQMFDNLQSSYKTLVKKIQHVQNVTAQTELDLTKSPSAGTFDSFTIINRSFILTASKSSSIITFNMDTQKFSATEDARLDSILSWTAQKDNTLLILTNTGKLIQFNLQNSSVEAKEITWAKPQSQIILIAEYNSKLYAIDSTSGQISKHNPSTTGFGKGEFWITDTNTLKFDDSSDFIIDGDIYVAKNNGAIWKFQKGQEKTFNLTGVEPLLLGPTKIYTRNGSDLFFIMDNQNKRVIIWNKNSNSLVSQITSADFHQLKNIFPDEQNKKIYLLDENKIISVKY